MTPLAALTYSFFFGLLHGILPDEHTWPITFSYAIGGASGRAGIKSSLYFALAFTLQRMLVSELAYLALAPFLLSPTINGVVYIAVGATMAVAGAIVLRQNRYLHLHLLGHHHDQASKIETTGQALTTRHMPMATPPRVPPTRWTLIHGFIAGFGFGGFSLFVNTVAAPAMGSAWLGFLPGLAFGLGTAATLVMVGGLFGASLRWWHALTEAEIRRIGVQTGGRTLFFGGFLFVIAGVVNLLGLDRNIPLDSGYLLVGSFMIGIALPAFVYSLRQVLAKREQEAAG
jgi:sulfite exporter TauE/SafE